MQSVVVYGTVSRVEADGGDDGYILVTGTTPTYIPIVVPAALGSPLGARGLTVAIPAMETVSDDPDEIASLLARQVSETGKPVVVTGYVR
jgi:hypothetical protein